MLYFILTLCNNYASRVLNQNDNILKIAEDGEKLIEAQRTTPRFAYVDKFEITFRSTEYGCDFVVRTVLASLNIYKRFDVNE